MTSEFGVCTVCGTPSVVDQKFCAVCGSPLSGAMTPAPSAPPAPEPVFSAPPVPPAYPLAPPPYASYPAFTSAPARAPRGRGLRLPARLLAFVVFLALVVPISVAYTGLAQVPVLSAAFGMDHARDLGMVADPAALDAFYAKWGIERPSPAANYVFTAAHQGAGSVAIDDTISEGALAALPEYNNPNKYFDGLQFRIHAGYVELSAFVHLPGYPVTGPVYGQASLVRTSSTSVTLNFSDLEFGRVGVPSTMVNQVVEHLNTVINREIADNGITIDTLVLQEGGIRFVGTWPQTITVP